MYRNLEVDTTFFSHVAVFQKPFKGSNNSIIHLVVFVINGSNGIWINKTFLSQLFILKLLLIRHFFKVIVPLQKRNNLT